MQEQYTKFRSENKASDGIDLLVRGGERERKQGFFLVQPYKKTAQKSSK